MRRRADASGSISAGRWRELASGSDGRRLAGVGGRARSEGSGHGAAGARHVASLIAAGLAAAAAVALAVLTGGLGAALTVVALTAGLTWWALRRGAPRGRLPWGLARRLMAACALWNAVSFAGYVIPDNGDTTSQRAATWARDHGFSPVIDRLETWVYDDPPSKTPANDLSLAPAISVAPTTTAAPTTTSPSAPTDTPTDTQTDSTMPGTTAPATTEPDPAPQPPAALVPPIGPALPGEGQWVPVAQAAGHDTMWATSIRPLGDVGGVVASMVVVDQTDLRAGMFNGNEEPGGSWVRGNHVPKDLQPALLAAMNGGFRFEHINGGYMTEGVVVKPLRDGDATVAIGRDGTLTIGALGADIVDDGSWASLRQNLILIVDGGVSQVQRGIDEGVWWGADYGRSVYVARSAICELVDGRIAYLMVADVNAEQLAQTLINVGCLQAMQMDINADWPQFAVYGHTPEGELDPQFIDQRMSGNRFRYLNGSTKEFFAFFDATLVATPSALDA